MIGAPMLIRNANKIRSSEITPKSAWLNRRQILAGGVGALTIGAGAAQAAKLDFTASTSDLRGELTPLDAITEYNNFYEFGTGKGDPAAYADALTTDPWTIKVDGLVNNPGTFALEDFIKPSQLEERIYRFRCVEAWSMVVPWIGFELADVIKRADPQGSAKYVAMETLVRPEEMRGQRSGILDWPYREGLRLDEAMHPLTILATGLYGEELPNQNGAPLRLVVPWKYGFKSIKSIVRITLVEDMPQTSWNMQNANEYGFYSNVNPEVSHPRWSQATERKVGAGLFAGREDTLKFNGYGDEVAGLYAGMDLAKFY